MKKKLCNNKLKKRETNYVSLKLFIIYSLLVLLDIITTLLTDKNLKYEGNIITTFFVNSHIGFIIYVLIIALTSILFAYFANKILIKRMSNNIYLFKNKAIVFFVSSIIIFFYTHIISLLWVIPNNVFHFISIKGNLDWTFYNISDKYVTFCSIHFPFYQISTQLIILLISFFLFLSRSHQIRKIK